MPAEQFEEPPASPGLLERIGLKIPYIRRFFLRRQVRTFLFVTHDRLLLRRLATRIVELDRGRLTSWECDYETYLERKDEALSAEAKQNHNFDKKLAQEEIWIRKGIRARRTRNEGRVRALEQMGEALIHHTTKNQSSG